MNFVPFFAGVISMILINKIFVIKNKKRVIFIAAIFFSFIVVGAITFRIIQWLQVFPESPFKPGQALSGVTNIILKFSFVEVLLFYVASGVSFLLIWINKIVRKYIDILVTTKHIILRVWLNFVFWYVPSAFLFIVSSSNNPGFMSPSPRVYVTFFSFVLFILISVVLVIYKSIKLRKESKIKV